MAIATFVFRNGGGDGHGGGSSGGNGGGDGGGGAPAAVTTVLMIPILHCRSSKNLLCCILADWLPTS